jgi:hypothetical protein
VTAAGSRSDVVSLRHPEITVCIEDFDLLRDSDGLSERIHASLAKRLVHA